MGIPYAEVIGDPIAHSKSPLIHGFWLAKLGLDYDFRASRVESGNLADFLRHRRADPDWRGCSVTLPHKVDVVGLVDETTPRAGAVGAVNCVTREGSRSPRLIGGNTDVSGFVVPLSPWLKRDDPCRMATVIGTGGAAAAVSYALRCHGFIILSVGRTVGKAAAFRRRLGLDDDPDFALDLESPAGSWFAGRGDRSRVLDVLVNASPLGMTGFPALPIDLGNSPPGLVVYDLVYDPRDTPLLRQARALGLATIGGLEMLLAQAAEAFELFFGEKPPREHDAELRELLTR
ncbi:MAG TPA: shikimate dehydrogenase [Allosphingosinicella sp.]|nr:shikimate dehydrogenase [Allosphingosinicella sp.]